MELDQPIPATALPVVAQPKGTRYWLGTWSGRILLINALVFVYTCVRTRSVFLPDTETLLLIGAKDPVSLALGEYWRLVTPMFIHIGILHFLVNSYMLYVIGYQLERILGGTWFVAVYLAAGIAGNISSAVFSVNLSAGASGALFGLLGTGFFLERTIGRRMQEVTGHRPRNRAYAMTVALNLGFGLLVFGLTGMIAEKLQPVISIRALDRKNLVEDLVKPLALPPCFWNIHLQELGKRLRLDLQEIRKIEMLRNPPKTFLLDQCALLVIPAKAGI